MLLTPNSRCIFCKQSSASSKSVEHIIPESLGNTEHVLPMGVVCDSCNNYFAIHVEGPVLSTPYFVNLRNQQRIRSKKGRVPIAHNPFPLNGIIPRASIAVQMNENGELSAVCENDQVKLRALSNVKSFRLYVPIPTNYIVPQLLESIVFQRFIAKIALEVVSQRLISIEGWESEIIDNERLDPIRNFARRGSRKIWPVHQRTIYNEDHVFRDMEHYQVLHEWMLLFTDNQELYAIICIAGEEYAINMGEPNISGYKDWLEEHNNQSPLYLATV